MAKKTPAKRKPISKKDLKKLINENGFFCQMNIDTETNVPDKFASQIPEGATYFEGIASSGELNRNGYIIDPNAWKSAIDDFMKNPIVLLQHDTGSPIGQCLDAQVTNKGLEVKGYIFDDMTNGAFGRDLLKALSTGHITTEVKFKNSETGEVIEEEQFRDLPYSEQFSDKWTPIVTALEWVEFSLVAIGSNRQSFVTKKNAIKQFLEDGKMSQLALNAYAETNADEEEEEEEKEKDEEEEAEDKEGEEQGKEEEAEEKENNADEEEEEEAEGKDEEEEGSDKTEETSEKAGESPDESEEAAENAGESEEGDSGEAKEEAENAESEENKVSISKEDREKLESCAAVLNEALSATFVKKEEEAASEKKDAIVEGTMEQKLELIKNMSPENILQTFDALNEVIKNQQTAMKELQAKLQTTPQKKALAMSPDFKGNGVEKNEDKKKKKGQGILQILENVVQLPTNNINNGLQ